MLPKRRKRKRVLSLPISLDFIVIFVTFLKDVYLENRIISFSIGEAQVRYRVLGNLGLGASILSFLSLAYWKWYFPPEVTASERHLLHIATMSGSAFLLSAQEMPKVSLHYPDN